MVEFDWTDTEDPTKASKILRTIEAAAIEKEMHYVANPKNTADSAFADMIDNNLAPILPWEKNG